MANHNKHRRSVQRHAQRRSGEESGPPGWLVPLAALITGLLGFSLLGGGGIFEGLIGALLLGGTALVAGQAITGSGLFSADGPIRSGLRGFTHPRQENTTPGPQFDQLVHETLQNGNGLFLGERHNSPAIRQAATQLLPTWKNRDGIGTVTYEITQAEVDELMTASSYQEFKSKFMRVGESQTLYELMQQAKANHIKVLGHEPPLAVLSPKLAQELEYGEQHGLTPMEAASLQKRIYAVRTSDEGIRRRDEWAAQHIRQQAVGKVVMIGGLAHSGNYTAADITPGTESYGIIKSDYQGVSDRLGFASIDFEHADAAHPAGTTEKTDGRFNTHIVNLPANLSSLAAPLAALNATAIETKMPLGPGNTPGMHGAARIR